MSKILLIFVCALFAACTTSKTNTPQPASANGTSNIAGMQNNSPEANSASVDSTNAASSAAASQSDSAIAAIVTKSVYFDYDKFSVKPEYRETLAHEVNLLKSNKNIIVTLEGNADERGSAAYNLALGEERAREVRKLLELLGVTASQIKVVSYGNERPKLDCHEEKCWHENRRVDLVQLHG